MEKEYQRTHTHTQRRSICFMSAQKTRKEENLALTFHIHAQKCKRGAVKISSTWQTDMLCRKKYSCLAPLPRLPSSQTLPGAKSHSSIFLHGAYTTQSASLCFCTRNTTPPGPVTHSLFHWVMMGSIWAQLYFFFFFSLSYYSGLFMQGETLPERTCTFLAKVRSRSVTQICTRELPNPNRVFGEKWEFKTLLKRTVILKCWFITNTCPAVRSNNNKLDFLNERRSIITLELIQFPAAWKFVIKCSIQQKQESEAGIPPLRLLLQRWPDNTDQMRNSFYYH